MRIFTLSILLALSLLSGCVGIRSYQPASRAGLTCKLLCDAEYERCTDRNAEIGDEIESVPALFLVSGMAVAGENRCRKRVNACYARCKSFHSARFSEDDGSDVARASVVPSEAPLASAESRQCVLASPST